MNAVPMAGTLDPRVRDDREYARKVERAQRMLLEQWGDRIAQAQKEERIRTSRLRREIEEADLSGLTGATYGAPSELTLPSGHVLRLKVEPDEYVSIMDEQGEGVWCGRLEWSDRRHDNRPDGFDGGAEVIYRDRGDRLWWQPPDDCKRDPEIRKAVRRQILDLLEYGYVVVILELLGPEPDAMGRRPVLDWYVLGAVVWSYDDAYIAEIVSHLRADMVHSMS